MEMFIVSGMLLPTKKAKDEEGAIPTIIIPLTVVVAKDEANALAKAHRLIPEEHVGKDERIELHALSFRTAVAAR
jgi:hypothetical protein